MVRILNAMRLPMAVVLAAVLGYMALTDPGIETFTLPDGTGASIGVPKSLEGWDLQPGTGDVLLEGGTRLSLMHLTIEKTGIAYDPEDVTELTQMVLDRHDQMRPQLEEYHPRLRGEVKRWHMIATPTAYAAYKDSWMGRKVEWALHDRYLPHNGEWIRFSIRYPHFAELYMDVDQFIMVNNLNLK